MEEERQRRRCGTSFFWIRTTFILLCLYQFFYTSTTTTITTTTTHHGEIINEVSNSLLSEPVEKKGGASSSSSSSSSSNIQEDDGKKSNNNNNNNNNDRHHHQKQQQQQLMKLLLLPTNNEIGRYDYFSDSWLLNRVDFLNIDITKISTVEDACFHVIDTHIMMNSKDINETTTNSINNKAMMFKDWTNFLVEHMSKWWKSLQILSSESTILFDHVITAIFQTYIETCYENMMVMVSSSSSSSSNADDYSLQDGGIAMIAFQSYESSIDVKRGYILTAYSLAATIVSLIKGLRFRRIVVVGYQPTDKDRIIESFEIIYKIFHNKKSSYIIEQSNHSQNIILQLRVGDRTLIKTDVVYVQIQNVEWVKTKDVAINIPRGAIMGMQLALTGKLDTKQTQNWLGDTSSQNNWKYFYLTEPDTILNIKPEIVPLIKQGLDHYGFSFFPHRLQPLPHESDLPSLSGMDVGDMIDSGRYIPNNIAPFSNVTTLINNPGRTKTTKNDSKNNKIASSSSMIASYCCDGGKVWPGRNEKFNGSTRQKPCNGKWWWGCGFKPATKKNKNNKNLELNNNPQQQHQQKRSRQKSKEEEVLELHKRLVPYPMMRLEGGTGVVFGSSEMGRRCFPSNNPCS